MDHSEYEQYVATVVKELDFCREAQVTTNGKYPGIRQPGRYEIDVAVEVMLSDHLFFFLIVECKNWARPVDRPVVQKLAQTRDAIGAHKAAIASPVGFTTEAVDVAKSLGIALWVISEGEYWGAVYCIGNVIGTYNWLHRDFVGALGPADYGDFKRSNTSLVHTRSAKIKDDPDKSNGKFTHWHIPSCYHHGGEDHATHEMMYDVYCRVQAQQDPTESELGQRLASWQAATTKKLREFARGNRMSINIDVALDGIAASDLGRFGSTITQLADEDNTQK